MSDNRRMLIHTFLQYHSFYKYNNLQSSTCFSNNGLVMKIYVIFIRNIYIYLLFLYIICIYVYWLSISKILNMYISIRKKIFAYCIMYLLYKIKLRRICLFQFSITCFNIYFNYFYLVICYNIYI